MGMVKEPVGISCDSKVVGADVKGSLGMGLPVVLLRTCAVL